MKRNRTSQSGEALHPFQRLQTQLAALIENTPPGERLTAEPKLARQLGVSRATLREAMRAFEGQGLIRRRQGVGTFVVGHARIIESGLEVLESIENIAARIELDVSTRDVKVSQVKANTAQAQALEVPAGTPLTQVARVMQAEKRPVAYLIDVLPEDVLSPVDLQTGFSGSVLDLLLRRGSPQLANSLTEIRAVAASSEIARAFEIQRGDVLLLFVARLFSVEGRVVDYSHSYFLPGYFRFQVVRRIEGGFSTI